MAKKPAAKKPTLTQRLKTAEDDVNEWKDEAESLAIELDKVAGIVRRTVPGWIRWTLFGVILLLALVGVFSGWHLGTAPKQELSTLGKLWHFGFAWIVSIGATAASLFMLTMALDIFTVRQEFMAKAKEGSADPLSLAIFSVGTAIYSGLVFFATMNVMSGVTL